MSQTGQAGFVEAWPGGRAGTQWNRPGRFGRVDATLFLLLPLSSEYDVPIYSSLLFLILRTLPQSSFNSWSILVVNDMASRQVEDEIETDGETDTEIDMVC